MVLLCAMSQTESTQPRNNVGILKKEKGMPFSFSKRSLPVTMPITNSYRLPPAVPNTMFSEQSCNLVNRCVCYHRDHFAIFHIFNSHPKLLIPYLTRDVGSVQD